MVTHVSTVTHVSMVTHVYTSPWLRAVVLEVDVRVDSLGPQQPEPAQPLGVTEVGGRWEGVTRQ